MTYDPNKRITINGIVNHPVFEKILGKSLNDKDWSPNKGYDLKISDINRDLDLGLSQQMKQSLTKKMDDKHVDRIFRKIDNFR